MEHILTLIASGEPLSGSAFSTASGVLADLGARTGPPAWLAEGRAADIPFAGVSCQAADAALRPLFAGQAVDLVAQPAAGRRKMLLVADMDSTIVSGETLDELADFAGIKDEIAQITARAMNGELDFKEAFRQRVARLKGLSADCFDEVLKRLALIDGARTLVATMRASGAYAVLASGGLRFFTGRVGLLVGFHTECGNEVEIKDGRLTGRVIEPIVDRDCKYLTLVDTAKARGLALEQTMAVGDGANDLKMLLAAGLGIAFHAKPSVAARARFRIDHADLTALLFAQGYRADEFKD